MGLFLFAATKRRFLHCPLTILLMLSLLASAVNAANITPHKAVARVAKPPLAGMLPSVPTFTSAALARNWGEAEEKAGRYDRACQAYLQEAALRVKIGDPEGAEVERRHAWRLGTSLTVGIPQPISQPATLAKLEPTAGCYIGTLDTPSEGRTFPGESMVGSFQDRIGRNVAVAFRYIRYGQEFPFAWAHAQAKAGRAIEIAMEPYDIYSVSDDEYLEGFASDLNQSGVYCFLRFGGEMNGFWAPWGKDPGAYKKAFRVVHDVMAHIAPRVAMVWAPNMIPVGNIDQYYPGDDVVNWVGESLYVVKYYDDNPAQSGWQDNPSFYIDPFYQKYAGRKPFCLVECGVSREAHADNGKSCDDFAAARIADLLSAIKLRYPRLKMFCWFDRNNLNGADMDRRLNDYSLPPGSAALTSFKTCVADPYFLSTIATDTDPPGTVTYQPITTEFPASYNGPISIALSTYCLNPVIEVQRGGNTRVVQRPFDFIMPPGTGPVMITVRDDQGRAAKTVTYFAR